MRISELIAELGEVLAERGDVKVTKVGWFENDDGWQVYVNYE